MGAKLKRSRACRLWFSILFHTGAAAQSCVHANTPIQREITVFELCGSWVSSLDPSDIHIAAFK